VAFLSQAHLFPWLDALQDTYDVYVPRKQGGLRFYTRYTVPTDDIEVRSTEPLKSFFTPPREKIAELFSPDIPPREHQPFAVVGVKACDLKGFLVQDQVFSNHGCPDPCYTRARDDNLIIAADCTQALTTCFCLAVGVQPYPESHFDLNLSEVTGGFVVEVGTVKGQLILDAYPDLFEEASAAALRERDTRRQQTVAQVQDAIDAAGVPAQEKYEGMIQRNYDAVIWQEEAKRCVECGACNTICPTCHCFVLTDQQVGEQFCRFREWDACMLKDFARVAGGGNPRPQLWMRLRNRFEKKFDFFPQVADVYACTGCGRCISACPAQIDIRHVLQRLVEHA
jgi:ferredoxin